MKTMKILVKTHILSLTCDHNSLNRRPTSARRSPKVIFPPQYPALETVTTTTCFKHLRTRLSWKSMSDKQVVVQNNDASSDYDLSQPISATTGLRQGLTSYGDAHFSLFLRKVFIKALGYSDDALTRPIIGIINTYSSFNPCHGNVPQLIEAVKRGVQLNGGLPMEFPTIRCAVDGLVLTMP